MIATLTFYGSGARQGFRKGAPKEKLVCTPSPSREAITKRLIR